MDSILEAQFEERFSNKIPQIEKDLVGCDLNALLSETTTVEQHIALIPAKGENAKYFGEPHLLAIAGGGAAGKNQHFHLSAIAGLDVGASSKGRRGVGISGVKFIKSNPCIMDKVRAHANKRGRFDEKQFLEAFNSYHFKRPASKVLKIPTDKLKEQVRTIFFHQISHRM